MEQNRALTALSWMVEALQLEAGDQRREADERLRIAEAMGGAPELRLQLAQGKLVNCIALSPDGSLLASGSDDGVVWITDVASGGSTCTNVMLDSVGALRFSPDATRVVAVDRAGRARVWNALTGEAVTPLLAAEDFSQGSDPDVVGKLTPAAAFSPDGKLVLLAWGSKSAQVRAAHNGRLVRQFRQLAEV